MTTLWKADPVHSEVQFKARHLMITTVTGYFRKFEIEVETEDEDFTKAKRIEFRADARSIDTNSQQRDTHLRSADFFDVEKFGQITFSGRTLEPAADGYILTGDLTIRGLSKSVSLDVQFGGLVVDPLGQRKAGFEVQGKISRREFGLLWNGMTEAGQVVVGDEIKIFCEIQLVKQLESNVHDRRESIESNAF